MPQANMMQQYQTPYGVTPPMSLTRPKPPTSAAPITRPFILPMLQRAAQAAMQKNQAQAAPTTPAGAAQAAAGGAGVGAGAGGLPSSLGEAFSADLMSPTGQAITQASLAGLAAGGWSPTPVTFGQGIAAMGQAGMKGYAAALKAKREQEAADIEAAYKQAKTKAELAKSGQAFSGTSMSAQSANTLISLSDKVANNEATPRELQIYSLAHSNLSRPRIQVQFDEQGNEIRTEIPAYDLSQFPTPPGARSGGPEPITTTKPTAEVLKDKRVVSTLGTMIKNLNVYRESLADPEFDRSDQVTGIIGVPSAEAARASGQAEALRLDLKNLYELGALVGGDFQILDRLLTAPATAAAAASGKENLLIQLEQLERQLENKLAEKGVELEGTISKQIVANSKEAYDKAPAYSYVRLPNGSIVLKGAK